MSEQQPLVLTHPDDALRALDKRWRAVGYASAEAYLARSRWLFRRVESIEFIERSAVRRRVSVDFHVPTALNGSNRDGLHENVRLVPLSSTPKWPPLAQFSLWGVDGQPASLYVRDTNKALDFGLLMGVLEGICEEAGDVRVPRELKRWLASLVASDSPPNKAVQHIIGQMREFLATEVIAVDRDPKLAERGAEALDLAGLLAGNSLLWVAVEAPPLQDCIVKFSYLDRIEHKGRLWSWRRALVSFGWREQAVFISLPHSGLHTRYHLEVLAPVGAGVEIMAARTLAFPGAPSLGIETREPGPLPEPGEATASARIVDRRVHIYHPVRVAPSHRMFLQLRWAASRAGYVTGCWLSALLIAIVMTAGLFGLPQVSDGVDPTIVLLAVVPVVLGYVLIKPAEHMLEREYVVGIRFMTLLAGSVPIVAALALIFCTPGDKQAVSTDVVRPWWVILTIISWLLVTGLTMSWIFAANGDDSSRDRRWTSAAPMAGFGVAAALFVAHIAGERQPYTAADPSGLRRNLLHQEPRILISAVALWIAAVAMWTFLGGTWRVVSKASYLPARARRGANGSAAETSRTKPLKGTAWVASVVAVVGMGTIWMLATAAAALLTAYQVMTVGDDGAERRLARGIDIAANATLVPACILTAATTFLLLKRQYSRQPVRVHDPEASGYKARRISRSVARAWLVGSSVGVILLIVLRGATAIGHTPLELPPWPAWSAFGFWVAVVAALTRDLRTELSPI